MDETGMGLTYTAMSFKVSRGFNCAFCFLLLKKLKIQVLTMPIPKPRYWYAEFGMHMLHTENRHVQAMFQSKVNTIMMINFHSMLISIRLSGKNTELYIANPTIQMWKQDLPVVLCICTKEVQDLRALKRPTSSELLQIIIIVV